MKASQSTKKTVVFGMRKDSPLEKKIKINRAKRSPQIKQFLACASDEEKREFSFDFMRLQAMLLHYASVSERLLVFIDNNVIEDIFKRGTLRKRAVRFHSFLAVLLLAQDYYLLDIFACMSPAVLFESTGKAYSCSSVDAENTIARIVDAIAEVGLHTHLIGFDDTEQLLSQFKEIAADEQTIRTALDEVIGRKWQHEFSNGSNSAIRIPFSLAEEEVPEMNLHYFHAGVVKHLFMRMIEKRMFNDNKNQPRARRLMLKIKKKAFSVLKTKGDGIEGLGDIELLTYCDLTSQTLGNSPHITMGITHDNSLYDTLAERSRVIYSGPSFEGGIDLPEDASRAFAHSIWETNKRTKKANKRLSEYAESMRIFYDDILKDAFAPLKA